MPKPSPSGPIPTVRPGTRLWGPLPRFGTLTASAGGNSGFPDRLGQDREVGTSGKYFERPSLTAPMIRIAPACTAAAPGWPRQQRSRELGTHAACLIGFAFGTGIVIAATPITTQASPIHAVADGLSPRNSTPSATPIGTRK